MPLPDVLEKLVSLAKRRGYVFQSSEIYGGLGSVWEYGPRGVELKRHMQERWWHAMVRSRDDIEGLDSAILMHPRVWEASGHVAGFTDPLVDCKKCRQRHRPDTLTKPVQRAERQSGDDARVQQRLRGGNDPRSLPVLPVGAPAFTQIADLRVASAPLLNANSVRKR